MFSNEKNIHMKNQIFVLGSQASPQEESRNDTRYLSEYHWTMEEAARKITTGEAYLMLDQMRAAGAVQDKNFNLINIDSNSYR